jgi:hypothetical protein
LGEGARQRGEGVFNALNIYNAHYPL